MNRAQRRARSALQQQAAAERPLRMAPIPRSQWPNWPFDAAPPVEVWWAKWGMVQIYAEPPGERLSFAPANLREAISWETLQRLKREIGRGDRWAVEIYPPDDMEKNVANIRHLWVLPHPPEFGWHQPRRIGGS